MFILNTLSASELLEVHGHPRPVSGFLGGGGKLCWGGAGMDGGNMGVVWYWVWNLEF